MRINKYFVTIVTLTIFFAAVGCTKQYTPLPLEQLEVMSRAETQTHSGITVSASVLSADESRHVFGVDLAKINVQPVWLTIKNDTDEKHFFLPMSVDSDFFSSHEVWWKTRYDKDKEASKRMEALFRELLIPNIIAPKSEISGFVLTSLHSGSVRMINVDVLGQSQVISFNYFLKIPGFLADHHLVEFENLYQEGDFTVCKTLKELKAQIEALPCCITNKNGDEEGDPLNIVIVSEPDAAWKAVVRRGWDETDPVTGSSAMNTVKIGRAACRERVCLTVESWVVGGTITKKRET